MPPLPPFGIARLPRLVFGEGVLATVPAEAAAFGRTALIVTGARSFRDTAHWPRLTHALRQRDIDILDLAIAGEPSPELVDEAVRAWRGRPIDVVIAIGGGSALDAGKAIAGLLKPGNSVLDHLEGVGPEKPYGGPSTPLIAVPTTAGTGSEATKNAVLSRPGEGGFKKSFRDEQLVAHVAIVDPTLLASCPPEVIAANGMDAFTQLLESLTSLKASPLTDALAWSGLEAFAEGFFGAWRGGDGEEARAGRSRLAYAALISGVCLAQTGLGAVHGLASPLGAFFPIPHGVCCGTLVAEATAVNLAALRARAPGSPALTKYARVAALLTGQTFATAEAAGTRLTELLGEWTATLALPRLRAFGLTAADIAKVVAESRGSSMKTNPIVLTDDEIAGVVRARL